MRYLIFMLMVSLIGCAVKHKRGADVDAVIAHYRANLSGAEACYRSGLESNPGLAGKVTLTWKVTIRGRAQDAKIAASDLNNSQVESCLIAHLESLSFPVQAKFSPAKVEYELELSRGGMSK